MFASRAVLYVALHRHPFGYKRDMEDKHIRDRSGEYFEDAFTENESKPRGPVRDEIEAGEQLDPDVDSQAADEAMDEDRFGVDERKTES